MSGNLPIVASVKEVYSGVSSHFIQLIGAAWLWLLVGVAAMMWMGYSAAQSGLSQMTPEQMETANISTSAIVQIALAIIIYVVATAGAAVKWHRFVLLGEHTGGNDVDTMSHAMRYVWTTIKIGAVYLLFFVILIFALSLMGAGGAGGNALVAMLSGAVGAALLLIVIPVVLRLSLALPDVALGGRGSLREMFGKTAGNGMQLLGYGLLIFFFLFVLIIAASFLLGSVLAVVIGSEAVKTPTPETEILMNIVQLPVTVFTMMIGVTMLSVAYREIIGLPSLNAADATAQPTD